MKPDQIIDPSDVETVVRVEMFGGFLRITTLSLDAPDVELHMLLEPSQAGILAEKIQNVLRARRQHKEG
jgi:hypothetical protein